jgi:hypothetical protein
MHICNIVTSKSTFQHQCETFATHTFTSISAGGCRGSGGPPWSPPGLEVLRRPMWEQHPAGAALGCRRRARLPLAGPRPWTMEEVATHAAGELLQQLVSGSIYARGGGCQHQISYRGGGQHISLSLTMAGVESVDSSRRC